MYGILQATMRDSIRRLFPVIEAFGDLTRLMWQFIVGTLLNKWWNKYYKSQTTFSFKH